MNELINPNLGPDPALLVGEQIDFQTPMRYSPPFQLKSQGIPRISQSCGTVCPWSPITLMTNNGASHTWGMSESLGDPRILIGLVFPNSLHSFRDSKIGLSTFGIRIPIRPVWVHSNRDEVKTLRFPISPRLSTA